MAAYEQPGYQDQLPGYPPANSHYGYGTAPGSDGHAYQREAAEADLVVGNPVVSVPYTSSQVDANMPRFAVEANDSQVPGQVPDREPFTGVGNTWRETFPGPGSPSSHVATPHHPNSNGVNRD